MYVNFIREVVDTEELRDKINNESKFKVETDLTKATKREDFAAFGLKISVNDIDEALSLAGIDVNSMEEDEKFDTYLNAAEELAETLAPIMPEYAYMDARAYTIDELENSVKLVIATCPERLGELKLNDVMKRLLNQVS
ncbi:MAG: hypothetical protein ACRC41_07530 [Sarcina sp.]